MPIEIGQVQSLEEGSTRQACFISSDKSRAATTLYGAMKFVAGESFIVNANHEDDGLHAANAITRLSCAVYGNVLNSTGSIIPLMWDAIKRKYDLTLYSPEMTRFMIDIEEAIDLIEQSLQLTGVNVVPNLKSFRLKDLFELYSEQFGLNYKTGVPRIAEKLHEIMLSSEELPRTRFDKDNNMYIMHYKKVFEDSPAFPGGEFSSKDVAVSKTILREILSKYDFFKA